MAEQELAVQMVNISKYFGGICAVHNANLTVKKRNNPRTFGRKRRWKIDFNENALRPVKMR